ncbi:MAG: SDR family oxidoreductase [Alphaproteobacteria bacterium]|jgi:3-oxoacyl-[acyl-carrier protein] reductase|nr:SDR family oxidoreductase [Alphaproteobacteria bacterium]MDP6254596.1 SDR family oxidoreductase [Alphaproteobacteria bacterium]MDP7056579.1 SDR family oxidoreductase [Alphaproteobacteria bacterium]MDP7230296.1 SDR family oxidoreductase [Alphaproteobacteria bacterium]MDP7458884.1 SDR family oxidoreductase [Alphaproteobacteria bacterium]|tara:strand:+ start:9525 stop:10304 length:780 start_codon:yes stop_codon:yes gene_type:complete
MDLGISGRNALVCASSRGLGKGCAMSLAMNGANVVVNGRDEAVTLATAAEISAVTDVSVTPVIADVSTKEGQAALLAACPEPDILVNNNGGPPFRDFRDLSREDMLQGVTMNFATPIELVQAVIDPMVAQGFGRIVNITSVSVMRPVFGLDLSSGARAGLTAFLAGVARSVAQHNVTINHILPGYIDTDRLRGGLAYNSQQNNISVGEAAARQAAEVPAKRFGNPEEFGEACAFLCSAQAGYITGQSLLLDGGLYASNF